MSPTAFETRLEDIICILLTDFVINTNFVVTSLPGNKQKTNII